MYHKDTSKVDLLTVIDWLNWQFPDLLQCHTPGHRGKWGNEQADRLAEKGANLPYTYNDEDGDPDDTDVDFIEADVWIPPSFFPYHRSLC